MISALGISHTDFDAADPGRLCRGRERWIAPYPLEGEAPLHRLVISGATFEDDSARDALRGVQHSGVDLAAVIAALFPRKRLLATMEDGHPADIPEGAEGVEVYLGHRAGGFDKEPLVRWHKVVSGVREIRALLGDDPNEDRVRTFALLADDTDIEALLPRLFLFTGMSTLDSPPARYQPAALPEVLELVKAVVVLHRDKHGPAVGVYAHEPVKLGARVQALADKAGALVVPFAIPPMLARWDRALAELRAVWPESHEEPFPVPPAPEGQRWQPRRSRRERRMRQEAGAHAKAAGEE